MCHQEGITPRFLNFKLANSSLKHSRRYKQFQSMLLKEDIKTKSSIVSKQKKEFEIVKNSIKKTLSLFGFARLFCLFLVGNIVYRNTWLGNIIIVFVIQQIC